MNERLTIQNLVDLLVSRHGVPQKDADVFVREFFLLIEQALENDQYVKIKGLGTFKLIGVNSRESVNINTGERIKIEGHTKISFTPDPSLRDIINRPFSHFETVVEYCIGRYADRGIGGRSGGCAWSRRNTVYRGCFRERAD